MKRTLALATLTSSALILLHISGCSSDDWNTFKDAFGQTTDRVLEQGAEGVATGIEQSTPIVKGILSTLGPAGIAGSAIWSIASGFLVRMLRAQGENT